MKAIDCTGFCLQVSDWKGTKYKLLLFRFLIITINKFRFIVVWGQKNTQKKPLVLLQGTLDSAKTQIICELDRSKIVCWSKNIFYIPIL